MKSTRFCMLLVLSQSVGLYALILFAFPQIGDEELLAKLSLSPVSMTSHFLGAGLSLIIGPCLFLNLSRKRLWVHKCFGRLYMIGVLLGGISGFYMGLQADGGLLGKTGFVLLSIVWLGTAYMAFSAIRANKIQDHMKFMYLNFSLTFAAVTLRFYLPIIFVFDLDFEIAYGVIAWLCWVPNIIVAWFLIAKKNNRLCRL